MLAYVFNVAAATDVAFVLLAGSPRPAVPVPESQYVFEIARNVLLQYPTIAPLLLAFPATVPIL